MAGDCFGDAGVANAAFNSCPSILPRSLFPKTVPGEGQGRDFRENLSPGAGTFAKIASPGEGFPPCPGVSEGQDLNGA